MIDKAGHIVTNYHVIQGASKVQVSFSGQDQIAATVVGTDPSTDTAVLKVDAHARALTPLPLGNSDAVTVGDPVYAIGNPFGFTRTLTSGLVSAVQRQIEAPNTLTIDHAIQTDAAINHGNSGGPLIDAAGRVIGVTSQISTGNTGGQGNVGIGFAIPINTVRNVAAQIITTGKAEHAFLGVSTFPLTTQLAQLFKLPDRPRAARADDPDGQRRRQGRPQGREDEGDRRRRLLRDRRRHHRRGSTASRSRPTSSSATRSRSTSPATRSSSRSTATARRRPSR